MHRRRKKSIIRHLNVNESLLDKLTPKYYVASICYYDANCDLIAEVMNETKTFSLAIVP